MRRFRGRLWNGAVVALVSIILVYSYLSCPFGLGDAQLQLLPERVEIEVEAGDQRLVDFTVVNRLPKAQRFRITTSCSCSTVDPSVLEVGAFGRRQVTVRVDTAVVTGSNTALVQVLTPDGAFRAQSVLMFVSRPQIVVDPEVVRVPPGEVGRALLYQTSDVSPAEVRVPCGELRTHLRKRGPRTWALEVEFLEGGVSSIQAQGRLRNIDILDKVGKTLAHVRVLLDSDWGVRIGRHESVGDQTRVWLLCEGVTCRALRVTDDDVQSGFELDGESTWIWLRFPYRMSGSKLALTIGVSDGKERTLSVELP